MIYPGRDSDPYHIPEIGSRSFKHPGQEVDITYPEKGVDSSIYPGKEGDHSRTRERPVAIYMSGEDRRAMFQITGKDDGYKHTRDRGSRYPGETGGNPRARDGGRRSFKQVPGR